LKNLTSNVKDFFKENNPFALMGEVEIGGRKLLGGESFIVTLIGESTGYDVVASGNLSGVEI